jgi:hypothetical protein
MCVQQDGTAVVALLQGAGGVLRLEQSCGCQPPLGKRQVRSKGRRVGGGGGGVGGGGSRPLTSAQAQHVWVCGGAGAAISP